MTGPRIPSDDRQYRVFAVELDDWFGPRRRADRPNIHLGVTCRDPKDLFDAARAGRGSAGVVREHGVRLRSDLTRGYGPTTRAEAQRQKRALTAKLMKRGFTVNGDTRVWRVYVIELDDGVGTRQHPNRPWVYVGETSLMPEERFEKHQHQVRNRKGPVYSRVVARHLLRLRPDLYEGEPVCYTRADSLVAEKALAERLARQGYSVRGGH